MNAELHRLQTLLVQDVMTPDVVEIGLHDTMSDAACLFIKHGLSAAPVIDEQGQCVGILTASDFVRKEAGEATASETLNHDDGEPANAKWHIDPVACNHVKTHMSDAVQTVAANLPLVESAKMLDAQHIHRLVVIDPKGHPIGMLSSMDIVAAVVNSVEEARLP